MAITRRTFLTSAAALAAAPALGQVAPSGEVDVAIIGAGAAGIAAARRVAAAGRRFALIEAGSHVGGRCFTDTRSFGAPFDTGAHWIRQSDSNPVVKATAKAGLDVYPVPAGQKIRIGARHARESELEAFFAAQVRATRAIGEAARGKTDLAAARALPNDLAEWQSTIEFALGPFGIANDLSEVSTMDFARLQRDGEAFCRQGYGSLLAKAAEGIAVQLSTPATGIQWERGLEVETPKGRISARAIIVTVSTNVLTAGKIRFSPELPRRHLDAAARLKLGTYERIALDMPGNPLGLAPDELVLERSNGASTAALLANVGRTPLCFVDVAGRFGQSIAAEGPMAMTDFALDWLGKLYGADFRKTVRGTQATQWIKDPLVLGGWSSAAPGAQQARRVLMEPLRDRLWFAGEAVHETAWGTVNGAWESGERAAEAALRKIAALQEPAKPAPKKREPQRGQRQRRQQR
ncbi:MAG TPA: NAD(P)/FAD-dependent oxidoreductase [Xanthobacteraceae bacterium]|nr:NAD(P)/FAD-dependent oxidoreductase [Xanthobacteraceae bacterium]